jgi:hypothetical protein
VEPEDLIGPCVAFPLEDPKQRVIVIVERHDDRFLEVSPTVIRAPRSDDMPELRPVLHGRPLPFHEGDGSPVDAHQAATGRDELEQVLPAFGFRYATADAVVEKNGVELPQ